MTSRDLNLLDEPITIKDYSIYKNDALPKIFLGFNLKNKYDEKRVKIKDRYKPKRISHFKWTSELEPMFVYGIEISPKKQFKPLLSDLKSSNISQIVEADFDKYVQTYKEVLADHSLTCNECYRYLSDGVYPIDVHHLDTISRKAYTKEIESGFSTMLDNNGQPWYASVPNFKLFILTWSSGYGFDYKINR